MARTCVEVVGIGGWVRGALSSQALGEAGDGGDRAKLEGVSRMVGLDTYVYVMYYSRLGVCRIHV